MREHPFELEVLERKRCTDIVEVFSVKTITVHARINREMSLASRAGFTKELVKRNRSAEIGNRRRQLEFNEVGEIRRSARTKHKNRQVHAVLAKQHAFADVRDTKIVGATKLGGKRTGEAAMAVGVRLDREQNLCRSRNLASDKLNIVAKGV